jgi:preprotein translocase subunit SecY
MKLPFDISKYVEAFIKYIPAVQKPTYKQGVNTRLKWTGVALLLYFILSFVRVYGISASNFEQYRFYEIVLGSKFGSLMTLGIGPIVTAGILLQLLVGSKILDWDTKTDEGRKKFQAWDKFLGVLLCFIEAATFVFAGALPVAGGLGMQVFVMLQLAGGAIIVILLDELVTKWGFGSGISLFIAAGVGNQILIRVLSPFTSICASGDLASCLPNAVNPPSGLLWSFIINVFSSNPIAAATAFLPIFATGIVFLLVVYVQDVQVEIPLSMSSMRGFGRNWGLKLLYTSNIPVILTAALIANVQLVGKMGIAPVAGTDFSCGPLGCFDTAGNVVSGIIYWITSPKSLASDLITGALTANESLRGLTYLIFMIACSVLFSVFWISTSGMDATSVAEQIEGAGMQIPGYRRDSRVMESVLNRYIPPLAVLSGITVGLFAAFADFIGALGTGTGMLLTVMIVYNYYEELRSQRLDEAHPVVRKLFGQE